MQRKRSGSRGQRGAPPHTPQQHRARAGPAAGMPPHQGGPYAGLAAAAAGLAGLAASAAPPPPAGGARAGGDTAKGGAVTGKPGPARGTDGKAQKRGPGAAKASKAGGEGEGDGEFGFYGLTLADAVGLGASAAGLAMALNVGAIPRGALQAIAGRDVAMAFVCFVGAVAWVKLFDVLTLKGVIHQTLSRKIVHITCGPVFVAFWPFFTGSVIAPYLASLVPVANMLRLGVIGTGIIRDEAAVRAVSREGNRLELLRGPFYYCIVLFFVTVVFWRANPVGAIVLATMCGGDGFADVVGRRFGASNKLPYNSSKSLAGSLAMFVGGVGLSVVLLGVLELGGCQTVDWPLTLRVTAATVAACTVLESLPINKVVDDNISVPILAAVMSSKLLGLGL